MRYQGRCKKCFLARCKERYIRKADEINQKIRAQRVANPERFRKYGQDKYKRIKLNAKRLAQHRATNARNMYSWREQNPDKIKQIRRKHYLRNKEKIMVHHKIKYATLRTEVVSAYGSKCVCCGETEPMFLAIDHVHNNGAEERRLHPEARNAGNRFLYWIKRRGFPADYQLLCHNCNYAKSRGGCPHQQQREVAA